MTPSASPDVILATCGKQPELTPSDAVLAAALAARGARVSVAPWDLVSANGAQPRTVCLRSTWDYHRRIGEFKDWLGAVAAGNRVVNPVATVLWNLDKQYLRELEKQGIAIPETRWFEPGEQPYLSDVLKAHGWERAVLKPRISATAYGTHLIKPGVLLMGNDWAQALATGGLIQEFVPEIQTGGEISLLYFGGAFSHAVRKTPAAGDYRVQGEFGGGAAAVEAPGSLVAFGTRVLEAAGRPWSYARVDVVEAGRGPVLMELELIEPELFLHLVPEAGEKLAEKLLK